MDFLILASDKSTVMTQSPYLAPAGDLNWIYTEYK